jgi:hypothetical protein
MDSLLSLQPVNPSKQKLNNVRLNPQANDLMMGIALLKVQNVDAFDEADVSKLRTVPLFPHSPRLNRLSEGDAIPLSTVVQYQADRAFSTFPSST